MTAVPAPRQPSPSFDPSGGNQPPDITPVFALKELVSRLHREQTKIQDLLSSLGFALRSFKNLNQFLELTPLIASRVTDADGGALVLYKPNGQVRLERLHCQDNHCQDVKSALESAARQLTATAPIASYSKASTHLSNRTASLDYYVTDSLGSTVQLFGTAIVTKSVERGRLYVFSRDPDYAWTETRQKLVRLVADQTAVAIENDELTVELRKKERLDRELEIGAEIQLQLLPRHCPTIDGLELAALCKTANRVGGDYYDFIAVDHDPLQAKKLGRVESDRWGLAIGDVMGKGVPAGLIMTMLRGMLRAEVLNAHPPAPDSATPEPCDVRRSGKFQSVCDAVLLRLRCQAPHLVLQQCRPQPAVALARCHRNAEAARYAGHADWLRYQLPVPRIPGAAPSRRYNYFLHRRFYRRGEPKWRSLR